MRNILKLCNKAPYLWINPALHLSLSSQDLTWPPTISNRRFHPYIINIHSSASLLSERETWVKPALTASTTFTPWAAGRVLVINEIYLQHLFVYKFINVSHLDQAQVVTESHAWCVDSAQSATNVSGKTSPTSKMHGEDKDLMTWRLHDT